jgi:serine/threonine protein kinase
MLTKLGKYVIKSELGRGAMGVVYLAEDPRLGRSVALKTMSPSVAGDPELLQRFYREAQSAGQLSHPNIVIIHDIDEADGTPFIAMEFLEGETLEKLIAARRDVPIVKKLDIMIQTCKGLHYAHQHGIVHRDVKPANIVVLTDGLVKILDFGIARVVGGNMTRTAW